MVNCGSLLKSALVAIVLVAMVESGSEAEKLASCCKTVSKQKITEPITGYMVQSANPPCVNAVIFQTAKGLYCSKIDAAWVLPKINEFRKAKTTPSSVVSSSTVSLLSIITSTASPPSSASFPSIPSISEIPADATFSESDYE